MPIRVSHKTLPYYIFTSHWNDFLEFGQFMVSVLGNNMRYAKGYFTRAGKRCRNKLEVKEMQIILKKRDYNFF